MPILKAVIFDIDGTLVDSVDMHAECWQRAFKQFGKEVRFLQIRRQIGKGGDQLMPVFFSAQEVERFGEQMEQWRTELWQREYAKKVKPFPQVRDLMLLIKRNGQRIALASSAKQEELRKYTQLLNIDDLVDVITSSDDVERSKPHPDIFQAALNKLKDVPADEAIVVGDSPYDAEAAAKIHLRTIGVLSGGFSEELLRAAGCIEIFGGPADLLAHYSQSSLAEAQAA